MVMSEQRTVTTLLPKDYIKDEPQKQIRIAAYCRVSTTSQEQEHSFAAQVKHYSEVIGKIPNGIMVDIYADEGISGRGIGKREEFNRLISDCRKGKVDRIITKSVSRFSRNLTDCLQTVRILSSMGVSILFEKEQIDTATMSSEVLLAMSGTQAQDESMSHGNNMRWSYERRMKNGEFIGNRPAYGYDLKDCATLVINEKEAEIVRKIFELYLSGNGKLKIAKYLNNHDIKYRDEKEWNVFIIHYILNNERYIGDALLQKKITTRDEVPRHIKNDGTVAQYYIENSHPPIITKEQRTAVLNLQEKRRPQNFQRGGHKLSKLLKCSDCGHTYRLINTPSGKVWRCSLRNSGRSNCSLYTVRENDVCQAIINAINNIYNNRTEMILPLISRIENLKSKINGTELKINEIDKEVAVLSRQSLRIADLLSHGILDSTDFVSQKSRIDTQIKQLRTKRNELLNLNETDEQLNKLKELNEMIESMETELQYFDEELIRAIVNYIIVISDTKLRIHLYGGLTITETLPKYCSRRYIK